MAPSSTPRRSHRLSTHESPPDEYQSKLTPRRSNRHPATTIEASTKKAITSVKTVPTKKALSKKSRASVKETPSTSIKKTPPSTKKMTASIIKTTASTTKMPASTTKMPASITKTTASITKTLTSTIPKPCITPPNIPWPILRRTADQQPSIITAQHLPFTTAQQQPPLTARQKPDNTQQSDIPKESIPNATAQKIPDSKAQKPHNRQNWLDPTQPPPLGPYIWPAPLAITAETSSHEYIISWQSDDAGIVPDDISGADSCIDYEFNGVGIVPRSPTTLKKSYVMKRWPDLVMKWLEMGVERRRQEQRTAGKFFAFTQQFLRDPKCHPMADTEAKDAPVTGINCDERMGLDQEHHWGSLKLCMRHPGPMRPPKICNGCRASQRGLGGKIMGFERALIEERGARMAFCDSCSLELLVRGINKKSCSCGWKVVCAACSDAELRSLAKARFLMAHKQNECQGCAVVMEPAYGLVDFCHWCSGVRVSTLVMERLAEIAPRGLSPMVTSKELSLRSAP